MLCFHFTDEQQYQFAFHTNIYLTLGHLLWVLELNQCLLYLKKLVMSAAYVMQNLRHLKYSFLARENNRMDAQEVWHSELQRYFHLCSDCWETVDLQNFHLMTGCCTWEPTWILIYPERCFEGEVHHTVWSQNVFPLGDSEVYLEIPAPHLLAFHSCKYIVIHTVTLIFLTELLLPT